MKNYNKSLKNKVSYPNNNDYINIQNQRDISKWLQAAKDISYKEKNGDNRLNSVRQVTSGWNTVEIFDFLNWFKFYEEGSHLKYKTAQLWYENGAPGYFLNIKKDPEQDQQNNLDLSTEVQPDEVSKSEKKQIIERQRAKLIGRLDSAEKLLRTRDGQLFADKELESLIEAIFALKKKVFLVNKISTATKLYEDMIIREANILTKKGYYNAANVLFSVADEVPNATSPQPPAESSGNVGGLPATGNGMPTDADSGTPNNTPQLAPSQETPLKKEVPDGLKIFLNRMETANTTADDELQVEDADIIIEAQSIPTIDEPMTSSPMPAPGNKKEPFTPLKEVSKRELPENSDELLEVEEEPLEVKDESGITNFPDQEESLPSNFDVKLDQLMSNITVADVIVELESLSKIFKTREIPRRLSRADMMLDGLGLASFFPSLSEAQNKSLEANNYISSRVDEILSKLRGSMHAKRIDLEGDVTVNKPELSGIKNKLQEDEDKEISRKKMRKEQEQELLESSKPLNKETPEIEMNEDLSKPVSTQPSIPQQQVIENKPILAK